MAANKKPRIRDAVVRYKFDDGGAVDQPLVDGMFQQIRQWIGLADMGDPDSREVLREVAVDVIEARWRREIHAVKPGGRKKIDDDGEKVFSERTARRRKREANANPHAAAAQGSNNPERRGSMRDEIAVRCNEGSLANRRSPIKGMRN